MTISITNLDDMDRDDLWQFFQTYQRASVKTRVAFLEGRTGKGTKTALKDLANYACNKAVAMDCRRRGDIIGAQGYDAICERIYSGLPEWARW